MLTRDRRSGSTINVRVLTGAILAVGLTIGWLALSSLLTSQETSAWAASPYSSPTPTGATHAGSSVTFTVVSGTHPTATPTPTPTRSHGSGGLPVTGNGPALMWTVVGGAILIAAGGVLLAMTRR